MAQRKVWVVIRSKWVFKLKRDGTYCLRCVAMGFTQVPGVNFTDSFAPVVYDVTVRILLILWMVYMWTTQMLDVETAFLYGDLDVPLYMHIPEGMDAPPNSCLKLLKTIYGLVQSSRVWWKTFTRHLKSKGFRVSREDQCLFV
mmetsp:Transcript_14597/g.22275  ORF Transcript_14597/g.22275 Transcript_14597/m.22275 type:complete len:143 (-) Transcript_14597:199-627(-)